MTKLHATLLAFVIASFVSRTLAEQVALGTCYSTANCLYGQHGVVYDESGAKTTNIENSNPICKGFVVNPLITKTTYACKGGCNNDCVRAPATLCASPTPSSLKPNMLSAALTVLFDVLFATHFMAERISPGACYSTDNCLNGQQAIVYGERKELATDISKSVTFCRRFIVRPEIKETTYACQGGCGHFCNRAHTGLFLMFNPGSSATARYNCIIRQ
ncbi:hypothetical protein BDZ90DRAFT_262997 [Jaminaea rosea]|uniref:Secreted protein n=1 Tax=Jaminaea rosea TaxID=1569628 RepID=A0A316UHN1_9BASI|nr:hypothetical protein BDZ90DRAFT_262997 [Jaminaea rosea]PWN24782.1 hypothetical protein BDZ90DRAFT_262997 [Jaminaea rosea]